MINIQEMNSHKISSMVQKFFGSQFGKDNVMALAIRIPKGVEPPDFPEGKEGICPYCNEHREQLMPFGFNGMDICTNCSVTPENKPSVQMRIEYYVMHGGELKKEK